MNNTIIYLRGLAIIQAVLAYEWWAAGWEKVWGPEFVGGIAKTLGYFASQNPFGWYKDFLTNYAIPNADLLGTLIQWSEVVVAVLMFLGVLYWAFMREAKCRSTAILNIIGLLGAMLMNANYYFAAGWTSPSTHGVNIVMFWAEAGLLYVWTMDLFNSYKA